MESIKISVSGNLTSVVSTAPVVAGTVGLGVEFSFDPTWGALKKTAVFRVGSKTRDVCDIGELVTVPWELLQSPGCRLWAGVYGVNAEGSLQIPTVWADLGVIQPGADPSGDESADPMLPVWEQVQKNTLRCTPQTLTPEQQEQVRQNIGVRSALVVTPSDNAQVASHKPLEIYAHVQNGGTAVFYDGYHIFGMAHCNEDSVHFSTRNDDYIDYVVLLNGLGEIKKVEMFYTPRQVLTDEIARIYDSLALLDDFNQDISNLYASIGDIETTLDSIIAIQESLIGGAAE